MATLALALLACGGGDQEASRTAERTTTTRERTTTTAAPELPGPASETCEHLMQADEQRQAAMDAAEAARVPGRLDLTTVNWDLFAGWVDLAVEAAADEGFDRLSADLRDVAAGIRENPPRLLVVTGAPYRDAVEACGGTGGA